MSGRREPGEEAGPSGAPADAGGSIDERDVPVYLPCEACRRPVLLRQARAAVYLAGALLCADCLPF